MKSLLIVALSLLFFGVALADPELFTKFLREHNKHYEGEELFRRFENFKQSLKTIERLNKEDAGKATYGINPLSDLTHDEFLAKYAKGAKGYKVLKHAMKTMPKATLPRPLFKGKAPESYDWRDHNAVTSVKDQGQCGSCWTFSTIANVEGLYSTKKSALVDLSEQNLVDCDHGCITIDGEEVCDGACDGGLPLIAYNYVKENGVNTEKDYPYTGRQGKCKFNPNKPVFKVSGSVQFPADEVELVDHLVQTGPLSIAIQATEKLQYYKSGVFEDTTCTDELNHAVTLVGYGVDSATKKPFWTVKNSWGSSWGEAGYVRFIRGKNNCGISDAVTSATL